MSVAWPIAELDPVRRLRVMAAAVPGAAIAERLLPAPLDAVWPLVADLERSVPQGSHVTALRIVGADGDRLESDVRGHLGLREDLRGVLRPGWCWLESRLLVLGMAAGMETADATRIAYLFALRIPGAAALRPLIQREIRAGHERLAGELGE